ncbi:type I-U CRISPR-associated helicase/endonuclease Cas3 [Sphaerotilus sulfidivorans]|uniref:type I-G CRISPR-associated helicase/endonuclease Cas3g n=1 Tax=Sphaerotilus sulfidivorans TaxID=639200 RepID=UPI00308110DC
MRHDIKQAGREVLIRLMSALGIGEPYPWQHEVLEAFCLGTVPGAIQVPTGAGKTAVMVCWLSALIAQAKHGKVILPRRYMVVINRRALVDAASDLAEALASALERPELADLRAVLAAMSPTGRLGEPLAVSTLRGQRADAGAWTIDPSRPAIIAATPDMAGSRLLFGGYGLGRSRRATHAGLLGVDMLIVHDEAHLSPALTALLRSIEAMAAAGAHRLGLPPLSVIEMTATPRDLPQGREVIRCDPDATPALLRRMKAAKALVRHATGGLADLVRSAVSAAREGRAVLVYLSSPEDAGKAAALITKAGVSQVACLTGTMRSFERDQLLETETVRRLRPHDGRPVGGAVLVATAAGEIGLDLDADVLLCDEVTLDRLAQRIGRCNRRGLAVGRIEIFPDAAKRPKGLDERIGLAMTLLQTLPLREDGAFDASPHALSMLLDHPDYATAIEPLPSQRELMRDVVDLYALTSARLEEPARSLYIHGVQPEQAEIRLAWRALPDTQREADLVEWLQAWPVSLREQARVPRFKADKLLEERLKTWGAKSAVPVLRLCDGEDRVEIIRPGRRLPRLQHGDVLILACELGGLAPGGVPDPAAADAVTDVSGRHVDAAGHERGDRVSLSLSCRSSDALGVRWRLGAGDDEAEDMVSAEGWHASLDSLLAIAMPGWQVAWHEPVQVASRWDGVLHCWLQRPGVRMPDDGDLASQSRCDRLLTEHHQLAGRAAAALLQGLPLVEPFRTALLQGAPVHDEGKSAERWQAAIGHRGGEPLAKSARTWFDARLSAGYRHELGSAAGLRDGSPLRRHLVAAHHGWARPVFDPKALDHPGCAAAARQASLDFARLHDTLGPWALAYLEALLKAVDIQAELMADVLLEAQDPPSVEGELKLDLDLFEPAARSWQVAANVCNPAEYFACLGVAALARALRPQQPLALQWLPGHFVLHGLDAGEVDELLERLSRARVEVAGPADEAQGEDGDDEDDGKGGGWPALELVIDAEVRLPLHAWISDAGIGSSEWKWSGGRTLALDIVQRLLLGVQQLRAAPAAAVLPLFQQGSALVSSNPDTAKFRLDASGAWTAVDVGYSLEQEKSPKSSRPWVELLSILGVQTFAPPPAGRKAGGWSYFTWTESLPFVVALAATAGRHPSCDRRLTLRTVLTNAGKYADALPSGLTALVRAPAGLLII